MKNEKIAFFVLSMNHEEFIPELIESLRNQTFLNFKVYWLDNTSKDKSFEIAEKLLFESGLEFEIEKNTKPAIIPVNLNYLLRKKGSEEYVGLISGDDFLHPENFEQKINFLRENENIPLIYSSGYYYYNDTKKKKLITDTIDLRGGRIYDDLLKRNFVFSIGTLIRSDIFSVVGIFDESVGIEDWEFYLRVSKDYEIGYITNPLFFYRQHTENMSLNVTVSYLEDCFKILKKHKKNKNHFIGADSLMNIYLKTLKKEKAPFFSTFVKIIKISSLRKKTISYLKIFLMK